MNNQAPWPLNLAGAVIKGAIAIVGVGVLLAVIAVNLTVGGIENAYRRITASADTMAADCDALPTPNERFECHKKKGETDATARSAEYRVQEELRAERAAKEAADRVNRQAQQAAAAKRDIQFHIDQAKTEAVKQAAKDAEFKRKMDEFTAAQAAHNEHARSRGTGGYGR